MTSNMASVAVLLIALVAGAAAAAGNQREFDYFLLVRQWPGTVCGPKASHPCRVPPEENIFTIHGLWPQYLDGGWPEECTDDDFDPRALNSLLPQLRHEWPSYYGANNAFWHHEWSKHGTCAESVLTDEVGYFSTVLSLNEKFNLTEILVDSDITPGTDQSVRTATVAAAIKDATGAQPMIHCFKENVYEIWMCINKDLEPFDCPSAAAAAGRDNGYCGKYVKMPSINARQQTYRRLRA